MCNVITKSGKPCKNTSIEDGRCFVHLKGASKKSPRKQKKAGSPKLEGADDIKLPKELLDASIKNAQGYISLNYNGSISIYKPGGVMIKGNMQIPSQPHVKKIKIMFGELTNFRTVVDLFPNVEDLTINVLYNYAPNQDHDNEPKYFQDAKDLLKLPLKRLTIESREPKEVYIENIKLLKDIDVTYLGKKIDPKKVKPTKPKKYSHIKRIEEIGVMVIYYVKAKVLFDLGILSEESIEGETVIVESIGSGKSSDFIIVYSDEGGLSTEQIDRRQFNNIVHRKDSDKVYKKIKTQDL